MRPKAQLFRKRRAHDHQVLARALCKQRSCSSNTAPRPHFRRVDKADWPSTSGIFRSLPGSRKSLSCHTFRSTSAAPEALLSMSTAPSWVAARLAPSAGLVVVQASRWAMRIQRMKTMASKQPRKQAKSGEKSDIGAANQPARGRPRTPRRRTLQARSKSTATQPVKQQRWRLLLPELLPKASDDRRTRRRHRRIRRHNLIGSRRASIWRWPGCLTPTGRERAQSARC
jgi:hypothetical protein